MKYDLSLLNQNFLKPIIFVNPLCFRDRFRGKKKKGAENVFSVIREKKKWKRKREESMIKEEKRKWERKGSRKRREGKKNKIRKGELEIIFKSLLYTVAIVEKNAILQ